MKINFKKIPKKSFRELKKKVGTPLEGHEPEVQSANIFTSDQNQNFICTK